MNGSSRQSLAAARAVLERVSVEVGPGRLADDLAAASDVVGGHSALRRSLADPARSADDKRRLVASLFAGRIGAQAMDVLEATVAGRWPKPEDLTSGLATLADEAQVAAADGAGRLDAVEEELFRLERLVSGDPALAQALSSREAPLDAKRSLVRRLLEGRVAPETLWFALRGVQHADYRPIGRYLHDVMTLTSARRRALSAIVTTATPLDDRRVQRLEVALAGLYGKPVHVNCEVDPAVMGGIHVRVGDEIIDGTILRRLGDAGRAMGVSG